MRIFFKTSITGSACYLEYTQIYTYFYTDCILGCLCKLFVCIQETRGSTLVHLLCLTAASARSLKPSIVAARQEVLSPAFRQMHIYCLPSCRLFINPNLTLSTVNTLRPLYGFFCSHLFAELFAGFLLASVQSDQA